MSQSTQKQSRWIVSGFLVLTVVYVGALVAMDRALTMGGLGQAARALPVVALFGLCGIAVRFLRWRLLLSRCGRPVAWRDALPAYVAGFAFTATPGKAGELVRARYFERLGVPHRMTVACFIIERGLDLVVIFAYASFIATRMPGFRVAALFVALLIGAIVLAARLSRIRLWMQAWLRRQRLHGGARLLRALFGGIELALRVLRWRDLAAVGALGIAAWALHLIGFALAMRMLGIALEWPLLLAIPAAAMLAGAASMLPGGLGATETAMVVLLTGFGERLELAALSAVTIRLGSIWLSILLGLAAITWLERRG